jgi:hypothetical protein
MSKSKTRKPDQRYGVINTGYKSKFGETLQTSQGPVTFDNDLVGVKNEDQMNEVAERYKGWVMPVSGERPKEPGTHAMFIMPDMSHIFRKRNRMEVQENEQEDKETRIRLRRALQETE